MPSSQAPSQAGPTEENAANDSYIHVCSELLSNSLKKQLTFVSPINQLIQVFVQVGNLFRTISLRLTAAKSRFFMPVTRSASRQSTAKTLTQSAKTSSSETKTKTPRKPKKQQLEAKPVTDVPASLPAVPLVHTVTTGAGPVEPPELLPAVLTFSLDEAKQHLIQADPRFEDLFSRLKCRPWEHLERVDPFR